MPTPLLILSDSPCSTSGLGRITRDLAVRIHTHMGDVFTVGCIGPGAGGEFDPPFFHHRVDQTPDWTVPNLPLIWKAFAGNQRGILLVIWDASRLLWLTHPEQYCRDEELRKFLLTKPFDLWTYTAIDAEGPNGKLSALLGYVLKGFDRILAYSEWSARIIERTIGDGITIESLPHGIDTSIFKRRGHEKARRKFGELCCGGEAPDLKIEDGKFLVGIVATNQARKDYGTAIRTAAQLAQVKDVLLWIRVDTMERFWSISALLYDYGLANRAIIQTGPMTDEQMAWAYSACDVTWGIGLGEGFGFPIYESLACGTPCIHGNYAGGAEWLPDAFKISPVAFRAEGTFASMRPVFRADEWVEATLRNSNADASLPAELDWKNSWPRWEAWLRKGIMTEIKSALIKNSDGETIVGIGMADLNLTHSDFRVYMRVENRRDLLDKAIASIPEFWPLLTVVDNSPDGMCDGLPDGITVMRGPVPLTFTQSHNWFYQDAKQRGAKFILWMHTDAEAIDGGHLRLLELARQYTAEGRKWGLIWTIYDSLCALNLEMIADVGGYDTIFPKYFCDNDHTRRMRLAGWETIDSGINTNHIGSQSILSDPKAKFLNDVTFPLYRQYYIRKWGGEPDRETFTVPFNGAMPK